MNMFVLLGILVVHWSLDGSDPDVERVVTRLFLAVHALLFAVVVYMFVRIWRRNDRTLVRVPASDSGSSEEGETLTHWHYDTVKLRDLALGKVIVPAVIGMLLSRRLHMPFPLLLQMVTNPVAVWDSQLCQIHVRGRDAHDALARPWKEATLVPDWIRDIWRESERESAALLARNGSGSSGSTTTASAGGGKAARRRR